MINIGGTVCIDLRGRPSLTDLESVVELYYDDVRHLFARFVGDCVTADDLTQEVFIRLCTALDKQREINNLWGFIRGIMKNVHLQHIRRHGRSINSERDISKIVDERSQCPAETAQHTDTIDMLIRLLGILDSEDQCLIVGRHFFEMTGNELAEYLHKPRRTVVDQYNRAMNKLRSLALERGLTL